MSINQKVLIVGGGPTGLWLAIEINARNPTVDIEIWEKRDEYTREQIVLLHDETIRNFPPIIRRQLFGKRGAGCYVKPPPMDQLARCYIYRYSNQILGTVVIKELEHVLASYLHNKVKFTKKTATETALQNATTKYDYIIGCDGKQSIVRKFIGGKLERNTIGYGLVMTFDSPEPALVRPNNKVVRGIQSGATQHIPQHRFRGFRSRGMNYYIAVQLRKNEYDRVTHARTLDDTPAYFQKLGQQAAAFYGMVLPDTLRNVKVASFPIELSISNVISDNIGKTRIAIIGDAFLGVNFFSGLGVNWGMMQATTLAKVIVGEESMSALYKQMQEYSSQRKKAISSLLIPEDDDFWQKKCVKISPLKRQRIGQYFGKDIRMLDATNQCLVIGRVLDAVKKSKSPSVRRRSCSWGRRKDGKCKRKPGPKSRSVRRRSCSRGRRKDGKCKRKPGPKSRSVRRRSYSKERRKSK
jgi:2-polyprenyl-6-methoxyphenol hydroxylase-like FAD-dependent oxidoreductase